MVDLYLNNNIFFGYRDSYNYYDIDFDNILLFKKSDNEFIVRYNDVNKMAIIPLQLKIKNFVSKVYTYAKNNKVFLTMIKKFLKNVTKYGLILLNQ